MELKLDHLRDNKGAKNEKSQQEAVSIPELIHTVDCFL